METVTFALTPHTSAIIVQRRRYVDAILRSMETKKQLRSRVLARRDALPEEVRARKSAAICARLEQVLAEALAGADEAGGSPVPSEPRAGDVPRMPSGSRAAGEASGRRAAGETGGTSGSPQMRFYRVAREQLDAAAAGFLGAPLRCLACEALERDGFQAVDPEELDAVVVPLVAFDDAGRRLGYGGGNYDQLLPRLRADAVVIGIAFDEQRVETVPCEPHDIALPRVVSG